jgi:hypothetical protein
MEDKTYYMQVYCPTDKNLHCLLLYRCEYYVVYSKRSIQPYCDVLRVLH